MPEEFKYYLPDENNNPIEKETSNHSVIIIGANGSGKSRLGAWMEQSKPDITYRIGAQRSLIFGDFIQQKSYEQASNLLIYGNEHKLMDHDHRWKFDGEKWNYTSAVLEDYESVLSALFALHSNQQAEYIADCKRKESLGEQHDKVPYMVIDQLQSIWRSVFPQREISFDDAKISAVYSKNDNIRKYKGRDMSDGERVALYLIAQALCVPENKTIIIDEPEIHLHRSIMNRLWNAIESVRPDCLFIYITHDTHFAASHISDKLWVKSYDGDKWELETIDQSNLPEDLLLDILGNRKNVLFVEGTPDSYDYKLYKIIYNDYYVIPCGSCTDVIARTKAMRCNSQLHHLQCYGIVDRDYRTDHELSCLLNDGIYFLNVAEVENLFIVEEILSFVNSTMAFRDNSKVDAAKEHVFNAFSEQINHQICNALVAEIKYTISNATIAGKDDSQIQESLSNAFQSIDYEEIKKAKHQIFEKALISRNYEEILRIFNQKSLSNTIGQYFDLPSKKYCSYVLRQLNSDKREALIESLKKYMPIEIPFRASNP